MKKTLLLLVSVVTLCSCGNYSKTFNSTEVTSALKYKDQNPIMLTSDNGLQLKSKILGFKTLSLKSFLKR